MLAAKVSEYSLRSRSKCPDQFDIRLLRLESTPYLYRGRNGRRYLWVGRVCIWRNQDLQSFGPLRLMVPELMGFEGRALVIDPDVFAVGDVYELLQRDMKGKAIVCAARADGFYSTAIMLLDCARLKHWQWNHMIDDIFALKLDLYECLRLSGENPDTIGFFEEGWNHLDTLNEHTKLLHNTERLTQPWKTGLPVDFDLGLIGSYPYTPGVRAGLSMLARQRLAWYSAPPLGNYQPHPDAKQVDFFFALLKEAIDNGAISEQFVADEVRRKHVRADTFELLGKVSRVGA